MRRLLAIAVATVLVALQPFPSRAGTTGNINGTVVSTDGAPVAGARVTVASPSQTAATQTDAAGRFAFLSLAPDTYTILASKTGFETNTLTGITIFADQIQSVRIVMAPSMRTIAHVTTRSSMDVVKPGTTTDVYSVNATVTQAAAAVGGGGNLNNAYSAIATVPGAFVPPNQSGWNQVVYIRGGNFDQVGYEFDGVPVNRSFDNYPGGTAGTLGQQELQVYAGGGTSGESASGLSGFINQVIKTGTFPGYASVDAALGTPTFYHNLTVEAGGATPDRLFSYYAGIGGYDQDFRYLDQFNGASLAEIGGNDQIAYNTTNLYNYAGVYPTCSYTQPKNGGFYGGPNASGIYDPFLYGEPGYATKPAFSADPGCFNTLSPAYFNYSNLSDRETVMNVHIGIPHRRDGGRDDVQILYNDDALLTKYYSSQNDLGPHLIQQLNALNVYKYSCRPPGYPSSYGPLQGSNACAALVGAAPALFWGDFVTWAPGTAFGSNAANARVVPYWEPSSPNGRCANIDPSVPGACPAGTYSLVPAAERDGFWNDASIFKLQYQRNFGSTAYLRLYGYTFYSDWLQNSPLSFGAPLYGFGTTSYDYELNSHTRGLALSFADQTSPSNLLEIDGNYVTATTNRYNNTTYNNGTGGPADSSQATSLVAGTTCIAWHGSGAGLPAPCNDPVTQGTYGAPVQTASCPPKRPNCIPANASWIVTQTGTSGFLNQVTPDFYAAVLDDKWDPTDKLVLDFGLRENVYDFNLANTTANGQNFWFAAGQREFCYNPITLAPIVLPAKPATGFPATPFVGFNCPLDTSDPAHPVQSVHPDGKGGHLLLSNQYSPTVSDTAFTPRFGATYTVDNNTVVRASAGRYVQEPSTYQVQYNAKDSNLAYDLFQAWWQYGFTTPRHDPLVQYSNNYDVSIEHRFKGTDLSMKLTPYYRYATNQVVSVALPFGLSGGLNTGIERADGVELELTKGDFSKNGFAFVFSYTYLNAAESYANYPGTNLNPIDPYNNDIANFNGLTKAGGGARCYANGPQFKLGYVADPGCVAIARAVPILNPYYGMTPQPLVDRNGWYPVGLDFAYLSPNTATAVFNYRRGRLAITPALQFNEGAPYGNPAAVAGIDPRTCYVNSKRLARNDPGLNPLQADYTSCTAAATNSGTSPGTLYVPDPATGAFDAFGAYRQPSQLNLALGVSYDVNARMTATAQLANLVNACFGGSATSWSAQYPPNASTCGYINNSYYVSNFYNGKSPNDVRANGTALNPIFRNPYVPGWGDSNAFVLPQPFNLYLRLNVKL